MKKALVVATVVGFVASFEKSDIRLLQQLGYEVHCAANYSKINDQIKIDELDSMGVLRHDMDFARSPLSRDNIIVYQKLKRLIEKEHFNLVHCHTPVGGALGRLVAHRCHVPMIIYTVHGFHFFKGCPVKNRIIYYPIEKYLSRYTDVLITINNEDFEVASRKFHAKTTERIHGVGIDLDKFKHGIDSRNEKRAELGISDDQKLLLSVGELDRDKNHIEILEAMKILGRKGYALAIAGTGSLMESYAQFIKTNRLEDCVQLLGYRRDVPELLQAADIYVFPSLFEGLSVALMEAVAAKIPIACSQVRGNVDTVVTPGSYFPTNDPNKLVEVVQRLSSMAEKERKGMVETNYQNLLKYRLPEVQKEMTAIYRFADKALEKAGTKG